MAQSVFTLDIGTSVVKMGEFTTTKSGLQLENYAIAPIDVIPGQDDRNDRVLQAVEDVMDELGIKKESVFLSISSQNVLARYVKMPFEDEEVRREEMVRYEAESSIPLPMEEVVWSYSMLGNEAEDEDEEVDTLILAIKEDLIDELTSDLESIGLKTELVDVAPMAVFNTVQYTYGNLAGCTLVIDMGARSTNLIFIENGKPFTRTITAVGGNYMTTRIGKEMDLEFLEAEDVKKEKGFVALGGAYADPDDEEAKVASKVLRTAMTRLHSEINRAINLYKGQQSGSEPDRVLLTGGASAMPYTTNFLQEKLGCEVEYLDPLAEVSIGRDVEEDGLEADARNLSEIVGLALRDELGADVELDLLPTRILDDEKRKRKQGWFLGALALLLTSAVIWTLYHRYMVSQGKQGIVQVTSIQTDLNKKGESISGEIKKMEAEKAKVDRLMVVPARRDRWLKIVSALTSKIPEGMWLYSLAPIEGTIEAPKPEEPKEGANGAPPQPQQPGFGGPQGFGAAEGPQKKGIIAVNIVGLVYQDVMTREEVRDVMNVITEVKVPGTQKRMFKALVDPKIPPVEQGKDVETPARPIEFTATYTLEQPIEIEGNKPNNPGNNFGL